MLCAVLCIFIHCGCNDFMYVCLLHCTLASSAQCIVIGPVSGSVCGCVCWWDITTIWWINSWYKHQVAGTSIYDIYSLLQKCLQASKDSCKQATSSTQKTLLFLLLAFSLHRHRCRCLPRPPVVRSWAGPYELWSSDSGTLPMSSSRTLWLLATCRIFPRVDS